MTEGNYDQQKQWQKFRQQAESGHLHIEDDIGAELFKNCEELISDLENALRTVRNLGVLSGYGGLPSALALQKKFEQKAIGGGADPDDNAAARLKEHIDVAKLMSDTYRLATDKLRDQDEANARRFVGLS